MRQALTGRQKTLYRFMLGYFAKHLRPPSLREMACFMETALNGVTHHTKALESKGWIRSTPGMARGFEIVGLNEHLEKPIAEFIAKNPQE